MKRVELTDLNGFDYFDIGDEELAIKFAQLLWQLTFSTDCFEEERVEEAKETTVNIFNNLIDKEHEDDDDLAADMLAHLILSIVEVFDYKFNVIEHITWKKLIDNDAALEDDESLN